MLNENCNITESQMAEGAVTVPSTNQITKSLQKIQNNRFLNQKIYLLFINQKYDQCLRLIETCKEDQYKIYMRSLVYQRQFRLESTLEMLMECQIWNRTNYHYLKGLAHNFYLLAKYKSSLEVAKEAYRANNSDYEIMYILAKISLALGDRNGAITHYTSAINKQPNEQSYIELSKLHIEDRKFGEAYEELNKALNISPQNPEIHHLLGQISLQRGNQDTAQKHFIASLERDSDHYQTLFSTAVLKQTQNEIQQAFQYLKRIHTHSPNSSGLWNNLAANMLAKNKLIAAYCCLKKALFLQPFKWDIHTNMATVFMHAKKYVAAQMHLRTALHLQSSGENHSFLYNLLGICLSELGDFINAEKAFIEGSKIKQDNNCLINYAVMLIKKGEKTRAKQICDQLSNKTLPGDLSNKLADLTMNAF